MDANFKREVVDQSLKDIKVELDYEFKRNFTRKGFFDEQKWAETKFTNPKGSLMVRSGGLKQSITSRLSRGEIHYSSPKPFARIHNEGGEITVTKKMRGYFMYRLKEVRGRYTTRKDGSRGNNKRNRSLSEQEKFYLAMVGKRVGDTITIPKRQFIGGGKSTEKIIREITSDNIEQFFKNHNLLKLKR